MDELELGGEKMEGKGR